MAALTEIAIGYHHAPALGPDWYAVPYGALHAVMPFLILACDDPAFARHADLLQRMRDDAVQLRELIEAVMQGGGKKQRQEAFYALLLRVWVAEGGNVTAGDPKEGSPCVRYLIKLVEAITGEKLTVSGARKIVRRQPSRRPPPRE